VISLGPENIWTYRNLLHASSLFPEICRCSWTAKCSHWWRTLHIERR